MAATQKQNIWPYSRTGSISPRVVTNKITASQSDYIAGHPFYVSATAGTVTKSDTCDGTGDVYHRIALANQTTELAGNTEIKMYQITRDVLWCIYVENNDSDSAAAQTIVGDRFGIRVATGAGKKGYTTLDINMTTNVAMLVDNIMSNVEGGIYTTSTSPGIAIAYFLPAVIDAERT
jgi:hypothetical protein